MKKILILIAALAVFAINSDNANAQMFQGETGIGKRINISLNLSAYSPKGDFKDFWDYYDFDGSKRNVGLSAGYALTEFAEFGLDLTHYGNFEVTNIYYMGDKLTETIYSLSAYAKINFINTQIASNASMQIYAKAAYGRMYFKDEYRYAGIKLTEDDDDNYYSYGFGVDFSLGENGNFIAGLEYRMHNADGDKFAASTGVNIGWRFGNTSASASSADF